MTGWELATMPGGRPGHLPGPSEDVVWLWECEARERVGDDEMAVKRFVAARYWRETRRPAADWRRVIAGRGWPRAEDRCAE